MREKEAILGRELLPLQDKIIKTTELIIFLRGRELITMIMVVVRGMVGGVVGGVVGVGVGEDIPLIGADIERKKTGIMQGEMEATNSEMI